MTEASITPAMAKRIELWPVERLVAYWGNARTHSAEQVAQIAASILEFGFTNPILVGSKDGIVAGHGRLLAARKLGLTKLPSRCLHQHSSCNQGGPDTARDLREQAAADQATAGASHPDRRRARRSAPEGDHPSGHQAGQHIHLSSDSLADLDVFCRKLGIASISDLSELGLAMAKWLLKRNVPGQVLSIQQTLGLKTA